LTTPLQMINAFAAIANGGVIMRPQIIEKIIDKDGKEEEKQPEEIRRVISDKAAAAMTAMLVSVVEKGHGTQAKVKGYKVAGKTGTAQVPLKNGLGYDPSRNIGSFIGFAPAMSPEFVVMAKIDSPKGVSWAESTAAPIVGQVLDYLLKYYQVPPTELSELNQ
ncbi:MAG: penicillin-binding transpeptidase domain-containing protein, partial [Patescibacteria group bacterium]|nr:penicillin-binding transpeptidase domain-containing protein [Patescibacteria group bacterium]